MEFFKRSCHLSPPPPPPPSSGREAERCHAANNQDNGKDLGSSGQSIPKKSRRASLTNSPYSMRSSIFVGRFLSLVILAVPACFTIPIPLPQTPTRPLVSKSSGRTILSTPPLTKTIAIIIRMASYCENEQMPMRSRCNKFFSSLQPLLPSSSSSLLSSPSFSLHARTDLPCFFLRS